MNGKTREIISTAKAPQAIGPYSQAVLAGNHLFISGQIPLDPVNGLMVEGGIEAETRQVFANLNAILESAGFSFQDAVYVQVFLADMSDFQAMNNIYTQFFESAPPARAAFEVSALPKGARIEIALQAIKLA